MSKVDSLRHELGLGPDSNRYKVLWGLAYELMDVNDEQGLVYASHAHDLALKQGDSARIVESGRIKGQLLRRLHKLDEALEVLLFVHPIAKRIGLTTELTRILNAEAVAYALKANYDKALEANFESLVIREKEGDKKQVSVALMNIGFTYYRMGTYDLALEYYLQSLNAKREVGDKASMESLLINIGLTYSEMRQYDKAQSYFEQALRSCAGNCNEEEVMQAEFGLASSLYKQGNPKEAEPHALKSLTISLAKSDTRFVLETYLMLGDAAVKAKDFSSARNYINKLDEIDEMSQFREVLRSFYRLEADYYTALNDYEKASAFLRKVGEVNDSIFSVDVIRNLSNVQTKIAQRENLAIIASQDEVLTLNDEVIRQQRVLNWLLVFIIVLTSVSGYVIYRNYQKIRMVNEDLARAKLVIEQHNHLLDRQVREKTRELRNTNESLQQANDELDNFIYKTSHDIRGPLASLKGIVNLAMMDVKDDKAMNYLTKLDLTAERLNLVLTRLLIVNRINHAELKPEPIHFEAIIQEILLLEMKKGIPEKVKVDYEVDHGIHFTSDREMIGLVLENLIDNAIKFHSESDRVASFVHVSINVENQRVVVAVRDNGVGISEQNRARIFQMFVRASERSETGGIGLYLAKIATERLFGEISLLDPSDKITEFRVTFPLNLQEILDRKRQEQLAQEVRQDLNVLTATESPRS